MFRVVTGTPTHYWALCATRCPDAPPPPPVQPPPPHARGGCVSDTMSDAASGTGPARSRGRRHIQRHHRPRGRAPGPFFLLRNVDLQPPSVTCQPPLVMPNRRRLPSNRCRLPPNGRQLPPTAISHPPTAVAYAVGYPPTAVAHPPTAVGHLPTAVGYPPTAVGHPPTAVGPKHRASYWTVVVALFDFHFKNALPKLSPATLRRGEADNWRPPIGPSRARPWGCGPQGRCAVLSQPVSSHGGRTQRPLSGQS